MHAPRRLRTATVIDGDAVFPPIHRYPIAVGSSLLNIFDVRGIAGEHCDFIRSRLLAPITRTAPIRLDHHHVLLRDGPLDFVRILLQINISEAGCHAVRALLDVYVRFVMQ